MQNDHINIYAEHEFDCFCGKKHRMSIGEVVIGSQAALRLPETVKRLELGKKGFLVTDEKIFQSFGQDIYSAWLEKNINIEKYILSGRVHPDENTIGKVICSVPFDVDYIISIGGGTITDIIRYVATRLNLPAISIPSAMTMDGFFTNMSVIVINGLQETYYIDYPKIILADTDIIAKAPGFMNAAGVGEVVSKISATMDLYAAHLIKDVYYCDDVNEMMGQCISEGTDPVVVDGLPSGNPKAIELLTDSLYKSAVGMAWYGSSPCGSGAEHQMNHYWMMCQDAKGIPQSMHGQAVGVGAIINMMIWEEILSLDFDDFDIEGALKKTWTREDWATKIREVYGDGAEDILQLQKENHNFDREKRRKEIECILMHRDELREKLHSLPSAERISKMLFECGGPNSPKQLKLEKEDIINSIYYAKDMRAGRYNSLWVAEALGVLDRVASKIISYFY
ncbi:MAG: iron-containing alcohol dehydrogenase [Eubacterium sp.]|nr:iron-containing alcohol dehydrogenase [Eubacterium sp.]